MYSTDGDTQSSSVIDPPPLIHLLPQLKAFLQIKDPNRVDRAMELLVNCQSEEELYADLQAQYGDVVVDEIAPSPPATSASSVDPIAHPASKKRENIDRLPNVTKKSKIVSDDEFIVADSDDLDEGDADSATENEYASSSSSSSELWEPDSSPGKSMQVKRTPSSPPSHLLTGPPPGPTTVCKYGPSCYRKNPVHFQEFAHPWLIHRKQ